MSNSVFKKAKSPSKVVMTPEDILSQNYEIYIDDFTKKIEETYYNLIDKSINKTRKFEAEVK